MLKSFTIPLCLALGLGVAADQADAQVVREGVRRTGEAVAETGQAVARGTRNAINRAGQATRNAVDGTVDTARTQTDRLPSDRLQYGVDSDLNARVQPDSTQAQAGAGINANQQYNSSPQTGQPGQLGNSAPQVEYQSGYRGLNNETFARGEAGYQGRVYRLRHDRYGREFICVSGRAVYFNNDQQGGQLNRHEAYKLNDEQMMNRNPVNQQQRPGQWDYQSQDAPRNGNYAPQSTPPAPPTPIRSDLNSAAPANSNLNGDTNISAEQRTGINESSDISTDANIDTSAEPGANTNAADVEAETSANADLDANAGDSDSGADASANREAPAKDANDSSAPSNE